MHNILWEIPLTPITGEPTFTALGKHQCKLSFYVEAEAGDRMMGLLFHRVEAYKCTYMTARSEDMIRIAYGKLVCLGSTPWLAEITELSLNYYRGTMKSLPNLRHLMICFDDGPCYEISCDSFEAL
jgi:hypothetical protein